MRHKGEKNSRSKGVGIVGGVGSEISKGVGAGGVPDGAPIQGVCSGEGASEFPGEHSVTTKE